MTQRVAIYARYSSDVQSPASIDDQQRLCRAHAEHEGWSVVEMFSDAAVSGALRDKPGLARLLSLVKAGGIDIVLAESLDRFARDLEHIAAFHKMVTFLSARIVTVSEGPISEIVVGLKGTMGALYLKELSEKTRRGLEGRIRQGRQIGSPAYGYRVVRQLNEKGEIERGLREVDAAEADVVKRIFLEYDTGSSPRSIAKRLNAAGIAGPNGGLWYDASIRGRPARQEGVLRNSLYAGRLIWKRRRTLKDPVTGQKVRRINAADELVVVAMPDLCVVDQILWERVQLRLQANEAPASSRQPKAGLVFEPALADGGSADLAAMPAAYWDRRRPRHLLSGKVICGGCGRPFTAVGQDYLGCLNAKNGGCPNTVTLRRIKLEARIVRAMQVELMPRDLVDHFIAAFASRWRALALASAGKWDVKRREVAVLDRKISALVDSIADGGHSPSLRARLIELELRRDSLAADLEGAGGDVLDDELPADLADAYHAKIRDLQVALGGLNGTAARDVARRLIDRVIVHPPKTTGDQPEIELIGDLRAMLQAAGLAPTTRRQEAAEEDPLSVFTSSVKEAPGAKPLA